MRQVIQKFLGVCFMVSLVSGAFVAKAQDITGDEASEEVSSVEGLQPSYCQSYNYEYLQCVQAGCQFDGRTGACFGGGYPQPQPPYPQPPHPQPQPNPYYCQQFNYNEFQCQQSGCFYDRRNGACTAQGGFPPGPPHGRGFVCTAVDAGFEEHRGGHQAIGRSQYEASNAAMGDCLRFHGRCRVTQCRPM